MAVFFEKRRLLKQGREWLHHARICRYMREDVTAPGILKELDEARAALQSVVDRRQADLVEKHCLAVQQAVRKVMPPRSFPALRENLEVLVVAIAVAMAFRCFFLQPFKIPTGSMQPTLFGIHYLAQPEKSVFDQGPLRFIRWLGLGEWYVEVTAQTAGIFRGPYKIERTGDGTANLYYDVGGLPHAIPDGLPLAVKSGDEVVTGQVIAKGVKVNGDHLFVNRVKWNFMKPQRGEVMVFRTDGIEGLPPETHYIKRMCGLPGETITIRAPEFWVNGKVVREPASILRNADRWPGYAGYCLGEIRQGARFINERHDSIALGPDQYLALGDNTRNSADGRYWGPVPAGNLVGPAMLVYWPLSQRWGWVH